MKWYVIQTKPMAEDGVCALLKNAGIEACSPKIRSAVRGKSCSTCRVKSLFPSYIFVSADLGDANLHRMIRYTRGVRKILGDGERPVPLPDGMLDLILDRMSGEGVIEQGLTMKKGDSVRIRRGAFKDLIGILEKPVTAAGRVRVLLEIMHHQIKCDISAADIEKE